MGKGKGKKEPQSFEEKFRALEEIVQQMEREDLPLEELLNKFEQGVSYLRELRQFLEEARQRVERFVEMTDQGPVLKEFALEGEEAYSAEAASADEGEPEEEEGEDEELWLEGLEDEGDDEGEGGGIFD